MSKAVVCQRLLHDEDDQKDEANQPSRAVIRQFQFHYCLQLQSLFSVQRELVKRENMKFHGHEGFDTLATESDRMTCRCIRRGRGMAKITQRRAKHS